MQKSVSKSKKTKSSKSIKRVDYPRIEQLGIKIRFQGKSKSSFILCSDLRKSLLDAGLDPNKFNQFYGVQSGTLTKLGPGIYPHDVEAVLERMLSGKLTGTQLIWD